MQADAAVHPGDDHDRIHLPDQIGVADPEGIELLRIELFLPVQTLPKPRADDMHDDESRDAQAKRQLQRLDRLPAELPALIERPKSEAAMHEYRGIERDRDRQELPEHRVVIDAGGERIDRDVAECVIEEM